MNNHDCGLPVIGEADLCILSGKLPLLRRALELAQQGKKIILAVRETCLAEDICQTFQYHLTTEECAFFPKETRTEALMLLRPDEGKRYLEERCLEAGIKLLYGVWPVDCREWEEGSEAGKGLHSEGSRKSLLRVAAKGGLFGILCDEVWGDAEMPSRESGYTYTALIGGLPDKGAVVKEGRAVWKDQEIPYLLEGEEGRGILTVSLPSSPDGNSCQAEGGEANPVRRAPWLSGKGSAGEIIISVFAQLQKEMPKLELGRFAPRPALAGAGEENPAGRKIPREEGKWISLPPGSVFPGGQNDPRRIPEDGRSRIGIGTGNGLHRCIPAAHEIMCREEEYDLVVAGGGTAGAMAALYGARGGLKTVLLEPQFTLGGTSTAGGVSTYWFGNRFSDVREIDSETERMASALKLPRREGIWSERDDFHPGIRAEALTRLCLEAGVEIRFGELVFGTVCDDIPGGGRRCKGAAAAGPAGLTVYYGKAVIDATGDGDLAVFSGAEAVYGSARDYITYWASLAQYTDVNRYQNNFSSMVISADPEDFTRFILLGRRRGEAVRDHGIYVSMRESRHVRGAYTVNLQDLMQFRTYPDGLYTCYSNYDPKGKLDADVIYCGMLPPQAQIQIPLSALLPCDESGGRIEGLYVSGKAVSATRNVFPSIRMQPDLMHQGAVLGGLLAESLKKGIYPEQMEAGERRDFLLHLTDDPLTLPCGETGEAAEAPSAMERLKEAAEAITAGSRTHWVDVPFLYEEKEKSEILSVAAAPSEAALPLLLKRLREETRPYDWTDKENLRIRLLEMCLWHGYAQAAEELSAFVIGELSSDALPEREGSTMCAQLLPDHGVMPETVYRLNLLGRSGRKCILPVFGKVLDLLSGMDRDYEDIHKGVYHYVESFAYAAEHCGNIDADAAAGFIPMLRRLIEFPEFAACLEKERQVELMTERLQILLLILCRALWGLGEEEGRKRLRELEKEPAGLAVRLSARKALEEAEEKGRKTDKIW